MMVAQHSCQLEPPMAMSEEEPMAQNRAEWVVER
jgi:hypothetical protein